MAKKKKTKKTAPPPEPTVTLTLTVKQVQLLIEGLDAHRYHELSDEEYRNSGFVMDPGSDDEEQAEQIVECDALESVLSRAIEAVSPPSPEATYLAAISATPK